MTTFADGLFQYGGSPVGAGLLTSKLFSTPSGTAQSKGRAWFVDASSGVNGDGKSPKKAFSTMQRAFNAVHSGDIIYFVGKVTEQLVTPVQVFDVTVVGCGNRPRHADASPAGSSWAASQWGPPASGAVSGQATVRVLQQGWRFVNILFTMESATAAGVEICRDAGSGDDERDASHTHVVGCKFVGAGVGIRCGVAGVYTEIPNHVVIEGNVFIDNTYAIRGAIQGQRWSIKKNEFQANTNHITAQLGASFIYDNIFGAFTDGGTTGGIDLSGGQGLNIITKNYLSSTYSEAGGYKKANADDEWAGNFNTLAGGITVSDPA
jgi:hypothetical protein